MDKIKLRSLLGNHFTIEKLPDSMNGNAEKYYQIIFNSNGYVLEQNELKKLKEFFQSIEF